MEFLNSHMEDNSAFMASFTSVLISEIGDKTFFIAAILAMRYSRIVAFCGSYSALFTQTLLSCMFGFILPQFLPKRYTEAIACLLFFFFGGKLLSEQLFGKEGDEGDELKEVEEEMEKVHNQMISSNRKNLKGKKNDHHQPPLLVLFTQAFTLTFLAEWGDRSQITTIAMSAAEDAQPVFFGAALAHMMCTGAAVIGGKVIASKISENMINLIGGSLFLLFGFRTGFQTYEQFKMM